MIMNLFVLIAILCTISPVLAEAEPHSGAHAGSKLRVAEAEPHSGAHPGPAKTKLTAKSLPLLAKKKATQMKVSTAGVAEKKVAPKREFVRGQKSVRLESVQQPQTLPQPGHVAGNRLLSQLRIYDSPECTEDSLFFGVGNAANVCIPEDNGFSVATSYTVLKVNTPEGTFVSEVQSLYSDKWCRYLTKSETTVYDAAPLDRCEPAPAESGYEGKFFKHIASKDVLLPTSTMNKGVLMTYYGGKRGCEERDMLGLTDYNFLPEQCMTDDGVFGSFKFSCGENGPVHTSYADDNCTEVNKITDISNVCDEGFFRADCITQPPPIV